MISAQQRKRYESFDIIIDSIRIVNDTLHTGWSVNYDIRTAINWLRSLSDETIHAYRKFVETTPVVHDHNNEPIFPGEFVMSAADKQIDDHEAALAVLIAMHVDSTPWDTSGSAGGTGHKNKLFDNAISRIRVLQQTVLFNHRKVVPDELYAAVIHSGIHSASDTTFAQMKSILEVTFAAWQYGTNRTDALYPSPGRTEYPSLSNSDLVQIALDYADRSDEICSIMKVRESTDPLVIRAILTSGHAAMTSGYL